MRDVDDADVEIDRVVLQDDQEIQCYVHYWGACGDVRGDLQVQGDQNNYCCLDLEGAEMSAPGLRRDDNGGSWR